MKNVTIKTYNFTLVLSGINQEMLENLETLEDVIFKAGCEDATLCFRDLIPYFEFDREASSFPEAVISAIQQVESINNKIKVERIEPDDLVTISDIAFRINKNIEDIKLLIEGKQGNSDLLQDLQEIAAKLYRFPKVLLHIWVGANGRLPLQCEHL